MLAIAVSGLLGASACDSTTASLPVLIITNSWGVEGDPDRSFIFQSQDDGETSGTFDGFEELEQGNIQNELEGSWQDGQIQFIVGGTRNDAVYEGTFSDSPDRLTVHSDDLDETLVLILGS